MLTETITAQAPSGEAEYLSWFPAAPKCSVCDEPGGRYRYVMSREHAVCDRCFIAWYEGAGTDRDSIRRSLGIDGVTAVDMTQPDCWAILTPNGSRLVPPDEAKGRKDAYPLYTAETVAAAYQCGLAAAGGVNAPDGGQPK